MQLPNGSIIASGPVIIENNKVLLNKEKKVTPISQSESSRGHQAEGTLGLDNGSVSLWLFPGGEVEDFDTSLEEACKREVKEELGIDVEIIKPLKPLVINKDGRVIILIHYLAKRIGEITPGPQTAQWAWHDINNLPSDCAPNVYEILKDI